MAALDLRAIAAQARTLGECLSDAGSEDGAAHDDAVARLHRWKRVAAGGDSAAFQRRLEWDDLTLERALSALAGRPPGYQKSLPAWAHAVEAISACAREIAHDGWTDAGDPPTDAGAPLPYEALLLPSVLVARRRMFPQSRVLTAAAHRDVEHALLGWLCRIAARAIHAMYVEGLTYGQTLRRTMSTRETRGRDREAHDAFVAGMLSAGLEPLFNRYPVLARLIGSAVDDHVAATAELVQRIGADREQLAHHFVGDADAETLGPVVSVRAHLSDFHAGGRSVCALTFTSGMRLVYKPKPLRLDVAFEALLEWCSSRGATPSLASPRVLDRGAYGWVEYIPHAASADAAAVEQFYERAGLLVAIVHALQGTDCHRGNLVAAGEHLVLIDLETLMHPEARLMSESHHLTDATAEVHGFFRDSVLRTGFVPRWDFDSNGNAFDVSGLGGAEAGGAQEQDLVWHDVGTDDIDLSLGTVAAALDAGTATLHGRPVSADDHVDALIAGFERMYSLLLANRSALLADDGPLAAFAGCDVRFLFRPTIVYALLRDNALAPEVLGCGIDRSITLEGLARGFLSQVERPHAWAVLRAELQAMERLDVPMFTSASDENALRLDGGGVLRDYFDVPGLAQVRAYIARMGAEDLARQVEILRLAFAARGAREDEVGVAAVRHAIAASGVSPDVVAPTANALLAAAAAIGNDIAVRAVRGADGSAAWVDIALAPLAGRFQLQPMGFNLYDGVGGIALFLAGLQHVTGDRRHHDLILGALMQPRRLVAAVRDTRGGTRRAHLQRIGLGGMTGIGSLVYVLVRVAGLIDAPALLEDAAEAAALLELDVIAADDQLDVMSGSAGALLGLLALHDATGSATVLERAIACGQRLLDTRVAIDDSTAAWPTVGGRHLAGFSHGASGIAHALLRLHGVTHDHRLLDAANAGIAYERRLYSPAHGGWPDLRRDGPPRFASSWCSGAAGVAIARAAALNRDPSVAGDLELAVQAVRSAGWDGVQHLCCGSAGRVEALLLASRSGEPHWRAEAEAGAASLLAAGASPGGYRFFNSAAPAVYSPGFFRGTAGVGYQFLRLANPALPSALQLE